MLHLCEIEHILSTLSNFIVLCHVATYKVRVLEYFINRVLFCTKDKLLMSFMLYFQLFSILIVFIEIMVHFISIILSLMMYNKTSLFPNTISA